ncbi:MAG TPA: HAD family phosphatase [Blastocatellia bacterium]|nr:HAD family phosphatase [Blastocatellia bacterium]
MLKAIIFDCDGVIADTEPIHMDALQRVLAGEGISLTKEDYFAEYLALDDRACFTKALSLDGLPDAQERVNELIRRKSQCVDKIIAEGVQILPGISEMIRGAANHYPLAIASGALRREIEAIVHNAGLDHFFKVIVSAEDVMRSKPYPDPFLKALDLFNQCLNETITPEECLVIEDSIHGIRAAHQASMRCLAVTNSYPKEKLAEAELVVDTLEGLSMNRLEMLFRQ